jgi:hypothetical protein
MHKNLKISLKKWDTGLWDRLKKRQKAWDETRHQSFYCELWHPCGFCTTFTCSNRDKPGRELCPLNRDNTCSNYFHQIPQKSPIRRMERYWVNHRKASFERARKELIAIMKSHADKFPEESIWD